MGLSLLLMIILYTTVVQTCAATVWDRVGNNLVTQAVLNPCDASPKAALSPAPPAPTTTASNV